MKTLQQFVSTLNEKDWVSAQLREGGRSDILYLITGPKFRRYDEVITLTFWLQPRSITVLGIEHVTLSSVEQLEEFLLGFMKHTAFEAVLENFKKMYKQPIRGSLRALSMEEISRDDVLVLIPWEEHKKLASSKPKATVKLYVRLDPAGTLSEYRNEFRYTCLESAGYGLRILDHGREGEVIRIEGTVLAGNEQR